MSPFPAVVFDLDGTLTVPGTTRPAPGAVALVEALHARGVDLAVATSASTAVARRVLDDLGIDDPLLDVAMKLEEAALKDDYFVQRKLYPNVDFYSGIIYKALKIPTEMFTVMFAIARTAGWISHWLEQQDDPENKIGRPRQIYTGHDSRDYVAIDKR